MRQVIVGALENMVSPVKCIMESMHLSLVNVAPERKEEFCDKFSEFILEYVDTHVWICEVYTESKHIRVSRRVVEVLWSASLAYFQLYQAVQSDAESMVSEETKVDLSPTTEIGRDCDLFRLILNAWLNKVDFVWPEEVRKPVPNPVHASLEHVAQELCLVALSYILHHELAHIELKHKGAAGIEAERDADYEAADWIFNKISFEATGEEEKMFTKRMLGVAVALTVLVARGIHLRKYNGITHPRSFDRLMNVIDRHLGDPDHVAWAFVVVALKLHLDNANHGAKIGASPSDSFRDRADKYVDALSRVA